MNTSKKKDQKEAPIISGIIVILDSREISIRQGKNHASCTD
jgi:hypothetical protein